MPCRFGAQAGACGRGGGRECLCSGSCAGSPRMGCEIGKASPIKALILPPQPAATQIHSREWDGPLAVPAIPGVMAGSWVCRWDPSLPGLGLSHGAQDTRWSPASQPLAGTGGPRCDRAETGEPASHKCSAPPCQSCSWKEICRMSLFTSGINLPLRQVNLRQNL